MNRVGIPRYAELQSIQNPINAVRVKAGQSGLSQSMFIQAVFAKKFQSSEDEARRMAANASVNQPIPWEHGNVGYGILYPRGVPQQKEPLRCFHDVALRA